MACGTVEAAQGPGQGLRAWATTSPPSESMHCGSSPTGLQRAPARTSVRPAPPTTSRERQRHIESHRRCVVGIEQNGTHTTECRPHPPTISREVQRRLERHLRGVVGIEQKGTASAFLALSEVFSAIFWTFYLPSSISTASSGSRGLPQTTTANDSNLRRSPQPLPSATSTLLNQLSTFNLDTITPLCVASAVLWPVGLWKQCKDPDKVYGPGRQRLPRLSLCTVEAAPQACNEHPHERAFAPPPRRPPANANEASSATEEAF
ncbi:hypothetical protein FRB90_008359 [Tulasnella sp. 427]|nr:hypothetical protein FRB90_008359 [Tulasnella sp. 427]